MGVIGLPSVRRVFRAVEIMAAAGLLATVPVAYAGGDAAAAAGEAIYQRGVLSSGAPLVAYREGGARVEGADAACINCHRRSGFGAKEGRIVIPPITGRYLMRPSEGEGAGSLPYVETMRLDRDPPYAVETLARAVRDGVDAQGRPFNYLMPHYELNDTDMAALTAYLKDLDRRTVPGVTDTALHFATIITPEADSVKRRGMLEVLEHYFAERNSVQRATTPVLRSSARTGWAKRMFKDSRQWELHVWELTGPVNTWEEQLKKRFAREPVMAVVSGLGGRNWEPVHAFCKDQEVPCLFPNVEVPPLTADHDFYSLYFSKGVLLEAGLIADRIVKPGDGKAVKMVQQVYRAGDSGEAGAKTLASILEKHGIKVRSQVLARSALGKGTAQAVRKAMRADAVVLWLRPRDIAALGPAPVAGKPVFMSGLMGGLEGAPLPAAWRTRTYLAYPFDLPESRRVSVDFALGWFRISGIPVVDEQVQADTYLACSLFSETMRHMADNVSPEYLVERIQDMVDHRIITGYYPHLTLAPNQRFASKGGHIVHFADLQDRRLVADSGWLVP